jgi:hypothetical protein
MTETKTHRIHFKTILILFFIVLFNIGFAYTLIAASHFFRAKTETNKKQIKELARKEGSYVFRNVY